MSRKKKKERKIKDQLKLRKKLQCLNNRVTLAGSINLILCHDRADRLVCDSYDMKKHELWCVVLSMAIKTQHCDKKQPVNRGKAQGKRKTKLASPTVFYTERKSGTDCMQLKLEIFLAENCTALVGKYSGDQLSPLWWMITPLMDDHLSDEW